jgi:hypothetical protein
MIFGGVFVFTLSFFPSRMYLCIADGYQTQLFSPAQHIACDDRIKCIAKSESPPIFNPGAKPTRAHNHPKSRVRLKQRV